MPYGKRRYRRRQKNKKSYRKKRSYKKPSSRYRKSSGFPSTLYTKLKYVERILITNTSGAIGTHRFSGNSIFDPNYEVGGHQPYYYDQYAAIYNNYYVSGSKITFRASTTNSVAVNMTVRATPDSTAIADLDLEMERPGALTKQINAYRPQTFKMYRSSNRVFGVKTKDEIAYSGLGNASPSDQWFWQIATQPSDETQTTYSYIYVSIVYYVKFWDRKGVSQS